jgi:uncharacterized pyridoxamine 5'-phosphate oxidase family protein
MSQASTTNSLLSLAATYIPRTLHQKRYTTTTRADKVLTARVKQVEGREGAGAPSRAFKRILHIVLSNVFVAAQLIIYYLQVARNPGVHFVGLRLQRIWLVLTGQEAFRYGLLLL